MSVMECKQRSFSAVRRKTLLNTEEEESREERSSAHREAACVNATQAYSEGTARISSPQEDGSHTKRIPVSLRLSSALKCFGDGEYVRHLSGSDTLNKH